MSQDREFDLVLFGATGFTGSIAAIYVTENAPTDLRWAIAGRSEQKLRKLKNELDSRNSDRSDVGLIIADLEPEALRQMVQRTKLVVTTVGPYCRYGSSLVEACANAGTHYVDCTGEHTWVLEMIEKHHDTAAKNGAIIVPQCAFESAPADLVSFSLVNAIRSKYNASTANIRFAVHDVLGTASGGTIETVMSVIEQYGPRKIAASSKPLALSPVKRSYKSPWTLPVFSDVDLGILTGWVQAIPDRAIVMRSWGLAKEGGSSVQYGDKFTFEEYIRFNYRLVALGLFITIQLATIALLFPPVRWLARQIVTQPGSGPSEEFRKKGRTEWRGVANVDDNSGRKAMCSLKYIKGDAYILTALFIVEAGLTILYDTKDSLAGKLKGGILTPACLGNAYLDRLDKAGVEVSTRFL